MFDRHATLNDTQIISYKVSSSEEWMVLIGIKSEVRAATVAAPIARRAARWVPVAPRRPSCSLRRPHPLPLPHLLLA